MASVSGKNGKGIYVRVHGKSWKKVKDKLRRAHFPEVSAEAYVRTMRKDKSVYAWMAELLRDSGHEEPNIEGLNGWLYRQDTDVYLETVEDCQRHESGEPA